MKLADFIGMQVAKVEAMPIGKYKALSVTRFDRMYNAERHIVMRRHMIDSCQALGFSVARKYERNEGSTRDVKDIREGVAWLNCLVFSEHCANPAQAKFDMLRWTIFNLLVCNADSHGKNYSFYVTPTGLEPTPWYDLVNVQMYPVFDQELATAIIDNLDRAVEETWEFTGTELEYVAVYKESIQTRCAYYLTQAEEIKYIML